MIQRQHLEAAIAVWKYCEDSAQFIFGQATGDRTADAILDALSEAGDQGLTKTQLSDLFSRKKQAVEINRALTLLQERGLINSSKEHTEGRSSLRYFLTSAEAKKAKKAKEAPDESMQADLSSLNSLNSREVEVDVIAAERLAIQEEGSRCNEPIF
jgi:transcription initiation factor IIE alpha subunit